MKTKLFLAAVAVTFSFAMMSCTGNQTNLFLFFFLFFIKLIFVNLARI